MRPRVTIVMTTFAPHGELGPIRIEACRKAIASLQTHIVYDGQLALHVADDGSAPGWAESVESEPATLWERGPHSFSRQEAHGVGASMNAGFLTAFATSPFAFYTVDDWELESDLDLRPWVDMVESDPTVGLVLFGPPSAHTFGEILNWQKVGELWTNHRPDPENWIYGLRIDPHRTNYGYTQRPALMHARFFERWGAMPEDGGAVWAESAFNQHWKRGNEADIVQAIEQVWRHLGAKAELGIVHPPDRWGA